MLWLTPHSGRGSFILASLIFFSSWQSYVLAVNLPHQVVDTTPRSSRPPSSRSTAAEGRPSRPGDPNEIDIAPNLPSLYEALVVSDMEEALSRQASAYLHPVRFTPSVRPSGDKLELAERDSHLDHSVNHLLGKPDEKEDSSSRSNVDGEASPFYQTLDPTQMSSASESALTSSARILKPLRLSSLRIRPASFNPQNSYDSTSIAPESPLLASEAEYCNFEAATRPKTSRKSREKIRISLEIEPAQEVPPVEPVTENTTNRPENASGSLGDKKDGVGQSMSSAASQVSALFHPPNETPQVWTVFWSSLRNAAHQPEAMAAIDHAAMLDMCPKKYYSDIDFEVSQRILKLPRRLDDQTLKLRNELAKSYGTAITSISLLPYYSVVYRSLIHPNILVSLPTFSGILFWRGSDIPSSSLLPCFSFGSSSKRIDPENIQYDQVYTLAGLTDLDKDDFFMGSRRPYPKWYTSVSDPLEYRIMLLCNTCTYIQPFLKDIVPEGFDAAMLPRSLSVRVLDLVVESDGLRTLILSEC